MPVDGRRGVVGVGGDEPDGVVGDVFSAGAVGIGVIVGQGVGGLEGDVSPPLLGEIQADPADDEASDEGGGGGQVFG